MLLGRKQNTHNYTLTHTHTRSYPVIPCSCVLLYIEILLWCISTHGTALFVCETSLRLETFSEAPTWEQEI